MKRCEVFRSSIPEDACSARDVMNTGLRARFSLLTHQFTHQYKNGSMRCNEAKAF